MTLEQIKMLKESYMVEATRPDGTKGTTGEYMRFITDCNIEFVTSKDMVLIDDANQAVHCVCYNEDGFSQSSFPVKIITAPYEDIHAIEAIMSKENFKAFLENGFFNNIEGFSIDKKNFMLKWANNIQNQAQKTPSQHRAPYYVNSKKPTVSIVSDLEGLVTAIAEGNSVTLTSNIDLENTLTVPGDCIINLNGNTLTAPTGKTALELKGGNVVINNGVIESTSDGIFINSVKNNGGKPCIVTIDKDVSIISGECCILIKGEGAVLNTNGTLHSDSNKYAAIQGNGLNGGIEINITGGMVSSNDCAIYLPCRAKLNISGDANIIGATAIYQKSGNMNISGNPTIIANGDKTEYKYNSNGCDVTGDAIVIEACEYPDGVPVVNIEGGTIISTKANAIAYYQQSKEYKLKNEQFISGGQFSSDVSAYVKNGYTCVKEGNLYILKLA